MTNDVFICIKRVMLAHEMRKTARMLCDYTKGRNLFGISLGMSGTAEYRLSTGESFTVGEGDVVFLSDDAKYTVLTDGNYHHYTVNFYLEKTPTSDLISGVGVTVKRAVNVKLYAGLFSMITGIWRAKKFGFELRAASVLYSILAELFHDMYRERTDDHAHRRLAPAKEYIDTHTTEDASLEMLAELVSMSETNFRREFSRLYGTSPIRYRDTVRLSHAKDALLSGEYTVTEAARACGFTDPSYFARFFKKHVGMTPREFMALG